jgi:hypothetical protein
VAVPRVGVAESVTSNSTLVLPTAVGVPASAPVDASVSPAGRVPVPNAQ